jgi:hypothetical protein
MKTSNFRRKLLSGFLKRSSTPKWVLISKDISRAVLNCVHAMIHKGAELLTGIREAEANANAVVGGMMATDVVAEVVLQEKIATLTSDRNEEPKVDLKIEQKLEVKVALTAGTNIHAEPARLHLSNHMVVDVKIQTDPLVAKVAKVYAIAIHADNTSRFAPMTFAVPRKSQA